MKDLLSHQGERQRGARDEAQREDRAVQGAQCDPTAPTTSAPTCGAGDLDFSISMRVPWYLASRLPPGCSSRETSCNLKNGGGGGNRTRVRRQFNESVYVRSLRIQSHAPPARQTRPSARQPERVSSGDPLAEVPGPVCISRRPVPLLQTKVDGTGCPLVRLPMRTSDRSQLCFFPSVLRGNGTSTRSSRLATPVEAVSPPMDKERAGRRIAVSLTNSI